MNNWLELGMTRQSFQQLVPTLLQSKIRKFRVAALQTQ